MKKSLKYTTIGIVIIGLVCLYCGLPVLAFFCLISRPIEVYSTTDISSYGVITGMNDDELAKELFSELFPEQIDESFKDVKYSYTAENIDQWDFEIYLEFVIEDKVQFQEYVRNLDASDMLCKTFRYDENYLEYVYSDWYEIQFNQGDNTISNTEIAKVLINPDEQRIITVALGVVDGGGAYVYDYTCFFDRFGIDPVEYTERPDYNHEDILEIKEWFSVLTE